MERVGEYVERFKDKKTAVAYSGGVDSSLVAFLAKDFADAVFVESEFTPDYMLKNAKEFTDKFRIPLRVLSMKILDGTRDNPPERCLICKERIFRGIKSAGYEIILDGTNADDLAEDRPGLKANLGEGVISPLAELGLGKEDVRRMMSKIDPEVALRPSETCLATRIPFGSEITAEKLMRIDSAEDFIRSLGIREVRVRDHFPLARICIPRTGFELILKSPNLVQRFKALGYEHITLDLEGMG